MNSDPFFLIQRSPSAPSAPFGIAGIVLLRLLAMVAALMPAAATAQLFENLQALSNRIKVGTRQTPPKGLTVADFDGDGRKDWAVSRLDGRLVVAFGLGNGQFSSLLEIPSPAGALRQ